MGRPPGIRRNMLARGHKSIRKSRSRLSTKRMFTAKVLPRNLRLSSRPIRSRAPSNQPRQKLPHTATRQRVLMHRAGRRANRKSNVWRSANRGSLSLPGQSAMRLIALLTRLLPATLLLAAPFASAGQTPPATQPLDDPLESLSARATRSEEDEDRLDALAHFSAGRVLQQRQQFKQALRQYERALRLDDAAGPALRDLVPLAFAAGRNDEGLRYLVKYAEQSTIEPELLEQAADYIAESGDWKGAIRLDERALAETKKGKPSPQQVLLNLQLGRLYALTEQDREAAAALKHVMEALEDPDKFGLDAKQRKNLLGDGGANYELMGTVFLEAKRVEDAKAAFEKFDSITPDPGILALNMARCELAAGKPQAALDELQKCTSAKTPVPTIAPYELLAKALAELKQSDQLLPRLEEMRKAQPKNIMLAYFLGQQYFEAGKFEKAQE